jgi:hypothetical protein
VSADDVVKCNLIDETQPIEYRFNALPGIADSEIGRMFETRLEAKKKAVFAKRNGDKI